MPIKPFEFLANAVRAKEIATVLARNGFADLLQKLDLPPRLLTAFGRPGLERRSQWERIRMVLEQLGPTFVKIGQLLSTRPDVVPEPLLLELRKLQEQVPPVPFDKIRPVLEEGLGCPWTEVFATFDEVAAAGASMAQVHFATLLAGGDRVAIKIQRPGLEKVIDADFDIIAWFLRQAHERIEDLRPYNLPAVLETLREGLESELDFRREARSLAVFCARNPTPEEVTAPRVYDALASRRVLVMERIDGRRLETVAPDTDLARLVARSGARSLFHQIMRLGFFHADPHAGNIRLMDDGRLCLLDWGLAGQLTQRMRYGLADLFAAFVRGDARRITRVAIDLSDTTEAIDRRKMEREVMLAIQGHYNPDTGSGDLGRAILKMLFVFGRNGVDLARDYSLMAKAILCVEETGKALDSRFNVREEFEPVLRDLTKERRSPRRALRELLDTLGSAFEQMRHSPEELMRILRKIERDNLNVNLQHKGLDKLEYTINDASNKVTLGIITGCLLVSSSLIVTAGVPPIVFGFPILGLVGYVLSFLLGIYVAFDILTGRRK